MKPLPEAPSATIAAHHGDLSKFQCDAIVNSAGPRMRPGGGVDLAIHNAAGPGLARAALLRAPCPVGEVRVTRAYRLPARIVIHTVAPRYAVNDAERQQLLYACFEKAIFQADWFGAKSVAFPAIGAGVFGWPIEKVTETALEAFHTQLRRCRFIEHVVVCSIDAAAIYTIDMAIQKRGGHALTDGLFRPDAILHDFTFSEAFVRIEEFLIHHWAFTRKTADGYDVIQMSDIGEISSIESYRSLRSAIAAIKRDDFSRWDPDSELSTFIPLPQWPPFIRPGLPSTVWLR